MRFDVIEKFQNLIESARTIPPFASIIRFAVHKKITIARIVSASRYLSSLSDRIPIRLKLNENNLSFSSTFCFYEKRM